MKLYLLFWAITFRDLSHSWAQSPTKVNLQQAIRESDIKRDLYALADDHFRGREAGTINELKASAWIAEQLRAMGLQPAGDDGTFFQFFSCNALESPKLPE